jgi:pimeloyl-ACP methyl ester carboxylesterase
VVGHSSGGVIALQLTLAAPEVVHSLVLLEPALLDVPSGPLFAEAIGPALQLYQAGNKAGAMDGFLRVAFGPAYRRLLNEQIPGGYAQALADADTFFAVELPSLGEWRFTREDAGRIAQPVLSVLGGESAKDWAGWPEAHARVQEWMPRAEPFVLEGSNHALEMMDPRGVATAMAAFFARHPMPSRA